MADLRVRKRKKKKQHGGVGVTTIKSLTEELLVDIFAKVGTRSIFDLCMVKGCCKEFLRAAEDDDVYRHVSMENLALVPLRWFTGDKESSFLKRCRESGNAEIAYREGMVQWFGSSRQEWGLMNLQKAALEGHHEAKYVNCMLLMCGEDEDQRKRGFELFCSLRESTCVSRCRKTVKSFVRSMWVNNKPAVGYRRSSFCASGTCDAERMKNLSGWSSLQDHDSRTIGFSCQCCCADYELALFCNMFPL